MWSQVSSSKVSIPNWLRPTLSKCCRLFATMTLTLRCCGRPDSHCSPMLCSVLAFYTKLGGIPKPSTKPLELSAGAGKAAPRPQGSNTNTPSHASKASTPTTSNVSGLSRLVTDGCAEQQHASTTPAASPAVSSPSGGQSAFMLSAVPHQATTLQPRRHSNVPLAPVAAVKTESSSARAKAEADAAAAAAHAAQQKMFSDLLSGLDSDVLFDD